jgi:hypothetical protein
MKIKRNKVRINAQPPNCPEVKLNIEISINVIVLTTN